ncbi:MAG: hypothetical protein ACXAC7_02260 [Candidatus Hodarchaeales archaeon]|jgi:hypothetical protein
MDQEKGQPPLEVSVSTSLESNPIDKLVKTFEKSLSIKSPMVRTGNLQQDVLRIMKMKGENYHFSFSGLRRSLGAHQQQLSNTLDRLLEDSILEKTQDGYALVHQSNQKIQETWDEQWLGRPLQQQPISVQKAYKYLQGRWFGKNRFLGGSYSRTQNIAALEWISIDNPASQTRLELNSKIVHAKFRGITLFERDKALNVFIDTLMSHSPIIFEKIQDYPKN